MAPKPGTYEYNRNHGIGRPGEVRRAAKRRRRQTPGTYEYRETHAETEAYDETCAYRKARMRSTEFYQLNADWINFKARMKYHGPDVYRKD